MLVDDVPRCGASKYWQRLANFAPSFVDIGPNLSESEPMRSVDSGGELGRVMSGQIWPSSDNIWSIPGQVLAEFGPSLVGFGKKVVEFGPNLADASRFGAKLGRARAKLGRFRSKDGLI